MHNYDDLIEALIRESELSTCSDSQKAANAHMINLYENLKNKRTTSDSPTYTNELSMDLMARRLSDPNYRFSVRSLMNER